MIGIGDAIGQAVHFILILSFFSLIIIPTLGVLGLKKQS